MKFEAAMKSLLVKKSKLHGIRTIAFVEGWSKRMQEAAGNLDHEGLMKPLLIFETRAQFSTLPTNLPHIIIEEEPGYCEEFVKSYAEIRKGKEEVNAIKKLMFEAPLFAAMLMKSNHVDGVVGGIHFPTANILRAAFKAIGASAGIKTISSVMIMHQNEKVYLFSDISVNPSPNTLELVDIAKNAKNFATLLNLEGKIAFLSFSTSGSAVHPSVELVANATKTFNIDNFPKALGEIQFDAAYDENVLKQKYKGEIDFTGIPNIFIFPDLNAGNIGYKIAQRLGGFGAIGPIITGLRQPMNDLSRGSTVGDITNTAIITALQAFALLGVDHD